MGRKKTRTDRSMPGRPPGCHGEYYLYTSIPNTLPLSTLTDPLLMKGRLPHNPSATYTSLLTSLLRSRKQRHLHPLRRVRPHRVGPELRNVHRPGQQKRMVGTLDAQRGRLDPTEHQNRLQIRPFSPTPPIPPRFPPRTQLFANPLALPTSSPWPGPTPSPSTTSSTRPPLPAPTPSHSTS